MTTESPMEEVIRTRRQAVAAALRIALAENEMGGVPTKAMKADDLFDIAARNHVRAVEALDPGRRVKGWREDVESTVLVLMDPVCRSGKHRECAGDPCECPCHLYGEPGVAA